MYVMRYGRSNPNFDYYIRDSENLTKRLEKIERIKDLGVTFTSDLNWKNHILEIKARPNIIFGSLKKAFVVETLLSEKIYISH